MAGQSVAASSVALRKVRTGKGTRLWKAQWGVIFNRRNRKQPPEFFFFFSGKGENAR